MPIAINELCLNHLITTRYVVCLIYNIINILGVAYYFLWNKFMVLYCIGKSTRTWWRWGDVWRFRWEDWWNLPASCTSQWCKCTIITSIITYDIFCKNQYTMYRLSYYNMMVFCLICTTSRFGEMHINFSIQNY